MLFRNDLYNIQINSITFNKLIIMEKKKNIYVHETQTIWADSGELHLECEQGSIVFNMQTLFNDLPSIFDLCLEEHDKNRQYIINQIKTIK